MINLTPEMLLKAKECKTAEEIVILAKENNVDCTIEQAQAYFNEINQTGELADDELDNVAGGGCEKTTCPNCESQKKITPFYDNQGKPWLYCKSCEYKWQNNYTL